jgi:hypothetical protein
MSFRDAILLKVNSDRGVKFNAWYELPLEVKRYFEWSVPCTVFFLSGELNPAVNLEQEKT